MEGWTLTATGLKETQSKFSRIIGRVPRKVKALNVQYAGILLLSMIRHSSGRPGPRVVTGEFIGGFKAQLLDGGYTVVVWNDSPQSSRLEHGFVGVDSKGRHYSQPPYPFATPSLMEVAPQYIKAMDDLVPELLK